MKLKSAVLLLAILIGLFACTPKNTLEQQNPTPQTSQQQEEGIFASEGLHIKFELPEYLQSCKEEEHNLALEANPIKDDNYVPKGSFVEITCENYSFVLRSESPDYQPYEGVLTLQKQPTPEELEAMCLPEENCKIYRGLQINDSLYDGAYADTNGTYWVSTYIPIENSSPYLTARMSLRLGELPDSSQSNYEKKVKLFLEGEFDEESQKRINDFQRLLDSVQNW